MNINSKNSENKKCEFIYKNDKGKTNYDFFKCKYIYQYSVKKIDNIYGKKIMKDINISGSPSSIWTKEKEKGIKILFLKSRRE